MRVLLLCSAFNGLSQRAWLALRARGHEVTVELAIDEAAMTSAVRLFDPDLIICPFLRERVPAEVWGRVRTIIIHPGPKGDRGPSSLDWAITDGASRWGVTALQAVEEMDAGPIWGTRTFPIDGGPPAKSSLYNGPVADAAIELIGEVVEKAADAAFEPEPLDERRPDVIGTLRPAMRATDRHFSWSDDTATIVRRIRAADGSPGVRTTLCDVPLAVFDAHAGPALLGEPGTVAQRHHDAVLVHTGDGSVWIGQVRILDRGVKLPAAVALARHLGGVPEVLQPLDQPSDVARDVAGRREIGYRRDGDVGVLSFDFYNGAMSTGQCRRLTSALRHAVAQDTKVLVIRGGDVFSNGIHLNVIHAAPSPAMEAWRNINAIDDVCREIISCTSQLVVTSIRGNAGAGGVMHGARRRSGHRPRRRRPQPALPDDGPVRIGVLDLRPAPPGRPHRRDRPHPAVPADRRGRGGIDRARRRGAARPTGRASTSRCSTTPDSWPDVATTGDCSTRSGRHERPTSSANRSTPTAPRSSPR